MLSIQGTAGRATSRFGAVHAASFVSHETGVPAPAPAVHIVELGDDGLQLSGWLSDDGKGACQHTALETFMDSELADTPSCLVIDIDIACRSHGDLGSFVRRMGGRCSIVLTAYGADIPTVVRAMKTGVIDFVEKPFRQCDILDAVEIALRADAERRVAAARNANVTRRYATLSQRERQVMALVTSGLLNKQAAGDLGVSEITVKAHRGAAMRKMGARSLADLVRMADLVSDVAASASWLQAA